jgi:hypothetical protein
MHIDIHNTFILYDDDLESEISGNDLQDMERSFQSMTEEVNYVR